MTCPRCCLTYASSPFCPEDGQPHEVANPYAAATAPMAEEDAVPAVPLTPRKGDEDAPDGWFPEPVALPAHYLTPEVARRYGDAAARAFYAYLRVGKVSTKGRLQTRDVLVTKNAVCFLSKPERKPGEQIVSRILMLADVKKVQWWSRGGAGAGELEYALFRMKPHVKEPEVMVRIDRSTYGRPMHPGSLPQLLDILKALAQHVPGGGHLHTEDASHLSERAFFALQQRAGSKPHPKEVLETRMRPAPATPFGNASLAEGIPINQALLPLSL